MVSDSLLSENDQKEQLSVAYVEAVAAKAGYATARYNVDRDSIDFQISAAGSMRPSLGLQLKATSSPVWQGDTLKFVLKRKNYDDLRADRMFPAILVVLVLAEREEEWLSCDETALILRRCAWWVSLKGEAAIETDSKTVYLPQTQMFNPDSLRDLMQRARGGSL